VEFITKLRRTRLVGHAACMGKMRNAYKILVRKPERKRREGNITMNLTEIV
jgi:hypothetical protein